MRLASKGGVGWRERESFRWFRLRKRVYQQFRFRHGAAKTVLFIVGCQRSGTSLLSHLFRLDWNAVSYDEVSPLSDRDPEGLRLNPLSEVKARIDADRAALVVCKPLVESQNLVPLLTEFPTSRAIWMFRDFRDVVRSNLRFFGSGNGRRDLVPIRAADAGNWRSEGVDPADLAVVRELAGAPLNDADAAALFWWVRNRLFFTKGYQLDERVARCDYDALVDRPGAVLAAAYAHLGLPYPGDRLVGDVFDSSRGRGSAVVLKPSIEKLCTDLLRDLRTAEGSFLAPK